MALLMIAVRDLTFPAGALHDVPIDFVTEISNPLRYRNQFDRLHRRYAKGRRMHRLTHRGVSLASLLLDGDRLSSMIASAIKRGTYELSPARVKTVQLDRPRELFYLEALDFLVHGVAADLVTDAIEPLLSPTLFSYRPGFSSWQAVRQFAAYVRKHLAARPDPRTRGLYVFRADVRRYADSVLVGDSSPLWGQLQRVLGLARSSFAWRLLVGLVRPEIIDAQGGRTVRCRGLPLGSPLTTPLLNLYLHDLDHDLAQLDGAFYARFGDDILLAHPQADALRAGVAILADRLERRKLDLHEEKRALLFFNGAARPSVTWPETRPSDVVVYLGCATRFDGTVALSHDKFRFVVKDVAARVRATDRLLRKEPMAARGSALCSVVNQALDPRSPLANRHAQRLRYLVTSRAQLGELDHLVARTIAEALARTGGPRAFREVRPKTLYECWGLASLVALRNAEG